MIGVVKRDSSSPLISLSDAPRLGHRSLDGLAQLAF